MESSPWLLGDGSNVKNNYSSKRTLILSLIFFFKLESTEDLVFIQVTAEDAFQHIMDLEYCPQGHRCIWKDTELTSPETMSLRVRTQEKGQHNPTLTPQSMHLNWGRGHQ